MSDRTRLRNLTQSVNDLANAVAAITAYLSNGGDVAARLDKSMELAERVLDATNVTPITITRVTRELRVVKDPHDGGMLWRLASNGLGNYRYLEHCFLGGEWKGALGSVMATESRVAMWVDLLANPTEEVRHEVL